VSNLDRNVPETDLEGTITLLRQRILRVGPRSPIHEASIDYPHIAYILGLARTYIADIREVHLDAHLIQNEQLVAQSILIVVFAPYHLAIDLTSCRAELAAEVLVCLPLVLFERETEVAVD
jgi:hypothetical protein